MPRYIQCRYCGKKALENEYCDYSPTKRHKAEQENTAFDIGATIGAFLAIKLIDCIKWLYVKLGALKFSVLMIAIVIAIYLYHKLG